MVIILIVPLILFLNFIHTYDDIFFTKSKNRLLLSPITLFSKFTTCYVVKPHILVKLNLFRNHWPNLLWCLLDFIPSSLNYIKLPLPARFFICFIRATSSNFLHDGTIPMGFLTPHLSLLNRFDSNYLYISVLRVILFLYIHLFLFYRILGVSRSTLVFLYEVGWLAVKVLYSGASFPFFPVLLVVV